jgi:hypothetical protein
MVRSRCFVQLSTYACGMHLPLLTSTSHNGVVSRRLLYVVLLAAVHLCGLVLFFFYLATYTPDLDFRPPPPHLTSSSGPSGPAALTPSTTTTSLAPPSASPQRAAPSALPSTYSPLYRPSSLSFFSF